MKFLKENWKMLVIVLVVADSEYSSNDKQVTIKAKLSVSDQFNYNKTDYLMNLTYSIDLKNNIFSNTITSLTKTKKTPLLVIVKFLVYW